ncbi:Pumilio homology domain family member 6 [Golovinomyces cichoracearum]|uniref:Pumilio homology domain family member 6 n=1 Tax=Golovinomyces cichoracearum TaxID=62708 RepID=A0A420H6R9_9PEZI|nr:Pumilio homology domain family member 6 [Golovinomyces cichoracearum]
MPSKIVEHTGNSGVKRKTAPAISGRNKECKIAKLEKSNKKSSTKYKSEINSASDKKHKNLSDNVSEEENSQNTSDSNQGDIINDEDGIEPSLGTEDGLHPERAKAVLQNTQSSREAHAKQKELAQKRKSAKPMADDLARTKKIWERLRRKSHVPLLERKELVKELFEIITGRVKDFVLKHDSVRVVQTAIKYANLEQKRIMAQEMTGTYRQLAESRYAKFLIGKLLVQGDDKIRDIIIPEFFGHVRRLIKHPEASWILDDVYRGAATKQQKARILRECYGAEYVLFQKDATEIVTAELSEIIQISPGKRASIMRSLLEFINQLIQKKMTGFTILHDAMLQYFLNVKAGTTEAEEFLEILKGDEEGDLFKNLAFTKSGSRLVCLALAHGNAKDRKQILRAYKDTLQMMAMDQYGHAVILTAYEVIDDTVFTAKSIFPELLSKDADKQVENSVNFANDLNARTTLLYLYQGRSKALFPTSLSSDLLLLQEVDNARKATSKKDPENRRSELAKQLSPYLLKVIEIAASRLIMTSFGCQFVTEVLLGVQGDKTVALNAVAATAVGDPTLSPQQALKEKTSDKIIDKLSSTVHNAASSHGAKMLRSLLAGGHFNPETNLIIPVVPALNFADILYPCIKDHLVQWATGPASFVVLALVESKSFSKKQEVLDLLKSEKEKLENASKGEISDKTTNQNKDLNTSDNISETIDTEKKFRNRKRIHTGNKGAELLLELI